MSDRVMQFRVGVVVLATAIIAGILIVLFGDLPSLVQVDAPNVLVETVKRAEDGRGWILRLFEAEGTACRCSLDFGGRACRIEQTNMLEETEAVLLEHGSRLDMTMRSFGIVTLRVLPA